MKISQYDAYYLSGKEIVDAVDLSDDEWTILIQNLINDKISNIDSNDYLSMSDVEWIDTNKCIPFCNNIGFIQRYKTNNKIISLVCGISGYIYLRFWLSSNGINNTLNDTLNEVFNGDNPEFILKSFWKWWDSISIESEKTGNIIVTKHRREFGIGHIYVWINSLIDSKEPKSIVDKYFYSLRPWMHANELYLIWKSGNLLIENNGKILPKQI